MRERAGKSMFVGRELQAVETVRAKALRWPQAWYVQEACVSGEKQETERVGKIREVADITEESQCLLTFQKAEFKKAQLLF